MCNYFRALFQGAGLPVTGLTELPVCPVCLERMVTSFNDNYKFTLASGLFMYV